jgi:hypothetical protein
MGKIRRGGFTFITWKGDHVPAHVHVYKEGRLVLKWDLEHDLVMKGTVTKRLHKIIVHLKREGQL